MRRRPKPKASPVARVRYVCGLVLAAVAAALVVFGAPATAILLLASGLLVARAGFGSIVLAGMALGMCVPTALYEYPARIDRLADRVAEGGPEALSVRDCASVWVLNAGVALGGLLVGVPEVAAETALLAVPRGDVVVFRSSFPAGSERVAAVVDGWAASSTGTANRVELPARRVTFRYDGPHREWRRALALDPLTMTGVAVREGGRLRIDVVARVPVDYPPTHSLRLFDGPFGAIVIHEPLFDALERRGWLSPYTAEWRWTEWVDDPV